MRVVGVVFCHHGASFGRDREAFPLILAKYGMPVRGQCAHEVWISWAHGAPRFRLAAAENEVREAAIRRQKILSGYC